MALLLALFGVAGVSAGFMRARRLRRWTPRVSPDLSEYDPGPDFLDWLRPAILVAAGVTLLVVGVAL